MGLVDLSLRVPLMEDSGARRFIYCVPLMEDSGARRFISCVPLMEDSCGS